MRAHLLPCLLAPLFSLLALSCASASPKGPEGGPSAGQDKPGAFDMAAQMAREKPKGASKRVKVAELGFEADVEATGEAKIGREGDVPTFTVPVGTEAPLQCFVYPDRVDGGAIFGGLIKNLGDGITPVAARIARVEVVGELPVMYLEIDYRTKTDKGLAAGMVKGAVQSGDAGSLFCVHDELGYRETFRRLVTGIVSSSKRPPSKDPTPRWREVSIAEVDGNPVGYAETYSLAREGGGRVLTEISAGLMVGGGRALGIDEVEVSVIDESGVLVKGVRVSTENGEKDEDLKLEQTGPRSYSVEGMFKGKPVKARFSTPTDLTSTFAQRAALRSLSTKPDVKLKFLVYIPSQSVDSATEALYRGEQGGKVSWLRGTMSGRAKIDAAGLFESAELFSKGPTLVVRRLFAKGEP